MAVGSAGKLQTERRRLSNRTYGVSIGSTGGHSCLGYIKDGVFLVQMGNYHLP